MSDEHEVDELLERRITEALAALERGESGVSRAARPFLETLGALPYALDPLPPSSEGKRSLLARIGASAAGDRGIEVTPAPAVATGGSRWLPRAAAIAALALLGVTGLQTARLARQERRLDAQAQRILELQDELAAALPAARRPPEWMVASGTELCALSPRPAGAASKGWLFVRRDHQHWYVAVEGLAAAPQGHVYELWFVVEGELVSAGTFHPDATGRAVLTSETMPNPVTGIAVTLEPDDGDGRPSETVVLFGDEVMLVL